MIPLRSLTVSPVTTVETMMGAYREILPWMRWLASKILGIVYAPVLLLWIPFFAFDMGMGAQYVNNEKFWAWLAIGAFAQVIAVIVGSPFVRHLGFASFIVYVSAASFLWHARYDEVFHRYDSEMAGALCCFVILGAAASGYSCWKLYRLGCSFAAQVLL